MDQFPSRNGKSQNVDKEVVKKNFTKRWTTWSEAEKVRSAKVESQPISGETSEMN